MLPQGWCLQCSSLTGEAGWLEEDGPAIGGRWNLNALSIFTSHFLSPGFRIEKESGPFQYFSGKVDPIQIMWILRGTFPSSFSSSSFFSLDNGQLVFVKEMFNLSPSLSCSLSAGVILKVSGWSKDQSTSESPSIWQSPREHWRYWPERLAVLQDSKVFASVPVKALARMRHTSTVDLIWTVNTPWSFSINNQQQCQRVLFTLEGFCAWSRSIGFLTLFAASQQLLLVVVLYVNCHFRSSLRVSHIPNCCCCVFKCSTAPGSNLLFLVVLHVALPSPIYTRHTCHLT